MRALLKRIAPGSTADRHVEHMLAAILLGVALTVGAQLVGGAMFDAMAGKTTIAAAW